MEIIEPKSKVRGLTVSYSCKREEKRKMKPSTAVHICFINLLRRLCPSSEC